ncbi:hypothetical protein ACJX0J_028398, partial [Zea mays]
IGIRIITAVGLNVRWIGTGAPLSLRTFLALTAARQAQTSQPNPVAEMNHLLYFFYLKLQVMLLWPDISVLDSFSLREEKLDWTILICCVEERSVSHRLLALKGFGLSLV